MLQHKKWTAEEEAYLCEQWGYTSIETIANNLGRTKNSVLNKKCKLKLGPFLDSGDYITVNQLYKCFRNRAFSTYQCKSWVADRGLPVKKKLVGNTRWTIIYLDAFWKWAEKNRSFIDFSKLEPNILGKEPAWVEQQRKNDYYAFALQRKDPWSKDEDQRLKHLLALQRYGYKELSEMLHRSAGAIQRRCKDLGLKDRPVKAENIGERAEWKPWMYEALAEGIRNGSSYTAIGNIVGKSEKAVRGKVYNTYFTEVADKVREYLGNGKWGENRPIPTVKQGRYLAEYRATTRNDLSLLAGILRYRVNEIGYEPYWQKLQCRHWDANHGCGAGCPNCDECTEFQRIPPQFCKRCGCTFYERAENNFCSACRKARKKQGYRKYIREAGRRI